MPAISKSAGEARQRPRPAPRPEVALAPGEVVSRSAGHAPAFDVERKQMNARAAPASAPKGMAANPWVRHWTSAGPAPEVGADEGRGQDAAGERAKPAGPRSRRGKPPR